MPPLLTVESATKRFGGLTANKDVSLSIEAGDVFVIATDGVHEYVGRPDLIQAMQSAGDPDAAADALAAIRDRLNSGQ